MKGIWYELFLWYSVSIFVKIVKKILKISPIANLRMLDTNLKTVFHRNTSLTRFEGGYAESAEYILICRIHSKQAANFLSLPILFYLQVASSINVTKCYPKS